jgi:hypothetical protein
MEDIQKLQQTVIKTIENDRNYFLTEAYASTKYRSSFDTANLDKAIQRFRAEVTSIVNNLAEHFASDPLAPAPVRYLATEMKEVGAKDTNFSKASVNTKGPGFGTALPHQPKEDPGWSEWRLFPYQENADVRFPSEFEQNTFNSNRYIGRGASGSTFSMYNAFREFEKTGDYNVGDAMLGAIMFMTFDSGHSMSDSMGGLASYIAYEEAGRDIPTGRKALDAFVLDYSTINLAHLGASAETQSAVAEKISQTFDRTVEWFGEIHEQRLSQQPGTQQ